MFRARLFAIHLALALVPCGAPGFAQAFIVNSPLDAHDASPDGICAIAGSGACTVRAALEEANAAPYYAFVSVPEGLFEMQLGAIELNPPGLIFLNGAGASRTIVRKAFSAPAKPFLNVYGGTIEIRDLQFSDFANDDFLGSGGAFRIGYGDVTFERCRFRSNHAEYRGGAIFADSFAHVALVDADFEGNTTTGPAGEGGAVFGGPLSILRSVFAGGSARYGGAVSVVAESRLADSLFLGNQAGDGGALLVHDWSHAVVINSSFDGNVATGFGGAIFELQRAELWVVNSTITQNRADSDLDAIGEGGGAFVVPPGSFFLANSIVSGNIGSITIEFPPPFPPAVEAWPQDCTGQVTSNGFNIVKAFFTNCPPGDNGCCEIAGGYSQSDPQLQPLVYAGGPTPTHPISPGSPAYNGGDPVGCTDDSGGINNHDQRGVDRPAFGPCDLGAFEYGNLIFDDDFELWEWKWSATVP